MGELCDFDHRWRFALPISSRPPGSPKLHYRGLQFGGTVRHSSDCQIVDESGRCLLHCRRNCFVGFIDLLQFFSTQIRRGKLNLDLLEGARKFEWRLIKVAHR